MKTISTIQEFEAYAASKGELLRVTETQEGYYAYYKTSVTSEDGFTSNVVSPNKGEYAVRLSKLDCDNQLVLKF